MWPLLNTYICSLQPAGWILPTGLCVFISKPKLYYPNQLKHSSDIHPECLTGILPFFFFLSVLDYWSDSVENLNLARPYSVVSCTLITNPSRVSNSSWQLSAPQEYEYLALTLFPRSYSSYLSYDDKSSLCEVDIPRSKKHGHGWPRGYGPSSTGTKIRWEWRWWCGT